MRQHYIFLAVIWLVMASVVVAIAQERSKAQGATGGAGAPATAKTQGSASSAVGSTDDSEERQMRVEGEKRFRNNCGRCHMAPQKFPTRIMTTVIRHMRVRATITDEDMRLILRYMTQ